MSINPLERFVKQKQQYEESVRKEGENAFKEFLKGWFEQNPDVYGVKWTQYTPYFNDGEPCEFRLGGVYAYKTQEAYEDETNDFYDNEGAEEVYGKGTLEATLSDAEDILLAAFGDHVMVSATRNEITVDEYDHN